MWYLFLLFLFVYYWIHLSTIRQNWWQRVVPIYVTPPIHMNLSCHTTLLYEKYFEYYYTHTCLEYQVASYTITIASLNKLDHIKNHIKKYVTVMPKCDYYYIKIIIIILVMRVTPLIHMHLSYYTILLYEKYFE